MIIKKKINSWPTVVVIKKNCYLNRLPSSGPWYSLQRFEALKAILSLWNIILFKVIRQIYIPVSTSPLLTNFLGESFKEVKIEILILLRRSLWFTSWMVNTFIHLPYLTLSGIISDVMIIKYSAFLYPDLNTQYSNSNLPERKKIMKKGKLISRFSFLFYLILFSFIFLSTYRNSNK